MKTLEQRHSGRSKDFIVKFEQISYLFPVLTMNR